MAPGSLSIREPRVPEESNRIVDLYEETARWHAKHWPQDMRASTTDELRSALPDLAEGDESRCLLVAVIDSAVVGLITAGLSPAPAGGLNYYRGPVVHIGDVVVTESARRRGDRRGDSPAPVRPPSYAPSCPEPHLP
jgi:hypothetical protein